MKTITKNVGGRVIPWFSDSQLIEMFQPESKQIIMTALAERQEEYNFIAGEIKAIILRARTKAPRDLWFYEIIAEKMPEYIPRLLKLEGHIYRLKWQLNSLKRKTSKQHEPKIAWQEKVEIALRYPVYELARSKLEPTPSGKNYKCLCFLHNEKTPSFYLYVETNTFVCFGCDHKGNVIKLAMLLYGVGFKDAVNMLQN